MIRRMSLFRLLGSAAWIVACAVSIKEAIRVQGWFAAVLLALAAFSAYMAHREFRDVRQTDPSTPLFRKRNARPSDTPIRYPLSDHLRSKLLEIVNALETAGVLQPGEVLRDELIACAETVDDFAEMDIVEVGSILRALREHNGRPFTNLAHFAGQVEMDDEGVIEIVREFARLSGQANELHGMQVRPIGASQIPSTPHPGRFTPNSVLEFELGARRHVIPFTMFSKNLPVGLMEGLASIFALPHQERRFFEAGFDSFLGVTLLAPAQAAALNAVLGEPHHFSTLHRSAQTPNGFSVSAPL